MILGLLQIVLLEYLECYLFLRVGDVLSQEDFGSEAATEFGDEVAVERIGLLERRLTCTWSFGWNIRIPETEWMHSDTEMMANNDI